MMGSIDGNMNNKRHPPAFTQEAEHQDSPGEVFFSKIDFSDVLNHKGPPRQELGGNVSVDERGEHGDVIDKRKTRKTDGGRCFALKEDVQSYQENSNT